MSLKAWQDEALTGGKYMSDKSHLRKSFAPSVRYSSGKNGDEAEKTANSIGNIFGTILSFAFIFYLLVAIIGVIGFFTNLNVMLYTATAILAVVFILQLIIGTCSFLSGVIFLPLGAIIGYLLYKSFAGAALGFNVVFIIRHLIRDTFYAFIRKLIELSKR